MMYPVTSVILTVTFCLLLDEATRVFQFEEELIFLKEYIIELEVKTYQKEDETIKKKNKFCK